MKKRVSASNIMRVVSILGIICLLALQWVWWRNAYRAVEQDFLKDTQECVKEAFDRAITLSMEGKNQKMKVEREDVSSENQKKIKFATKHSANHASEITFLIEELLYFENKPITGKQVDSQLDICLKNKFGEVPKHDLKIYRISNVIDSINKPMYNRIAIGNGQDTIYHQFGFMAYSVIVIPSPIELYLKKGSLILIFSIILMLLIGSILILQYLNMRRDRKFADFIIDYTRMMTHDLRTPERVFR